MYHISPPISPLRICSPQISSSFPSHFCYAGINLTGYHPPPPKADCRATNFFRQNPRPGGQLFSAKLRSPGRNKRNKIPTPGHNLPSSNAKISMKKDHNSKGAYFLSKFSIIVRLTIFFYHENKVFASFYTTLMIDTV